MRVSFRTIATTVALAFFGSATAAAACCTAPTGGPVVNVPHIPKTNYGGSGCCGHIGGGVIGTPGVIIGGSSVSVYNAGVHVGGTNVSVGGNTYVGGSSTTVFGGGGGGGGYFIGGGGGGFYAPAPVSTGVIEGLDLGRAAETITESASESYSETVAIRAVCMDAKGTPHPASRPSGELNVSANYDGEIFRCMAGTYMEVTVGKWLNGKSMFDGGRNISCVQGQALSYRGGNLVCTSQIPQANCNERSLLRRFGPGIKLATISGTRSVERTRTVQSTSVRTSMFIDGGVGQGVY